MNENVTDMRFSDDDQALYVATDERIYRWNFATDQQEVLLYAVKIKIDKPIRAWNPVIKIQSAKLAAKADIAVLVDDNKILLVDLVKGTTKVFGPRPNIPMTGADVSISATGKYIAVITEPTPSNAPCVPFSESKKSTDKLCRFQADAVITELATGKEVFRVRGAQRAVTFSEIDDVFAWGSTQQLHYVDLRKPKNYSPDDKTFFFKWKDNVAYLGKGDHENFEFNVTTQAVTSIAEKDIAGTGFVRPKATPKWVTAFAFGRPGGGPLGWNSTPPTRCAPTFRVWRAPVTTAKPPTKAVVATFRQPCDTDRDGWTVQSGIVVARRYFTATLYDAVSQTKMATLQPAKVSERYQPVLTRVVLSRDGATAAVLSWVPRMIGGDSPDDLTPHCLKPTTSSILDDPSCSRAYALDVYALNAATATHLVRVELPMESSTSEFNATGTAVYVGLVDGRVLIQPIAADAIGRTERLHSSAIRGFTFSPGDKMVATRDEENKVLLWPQQ